MCVHGFVKSNKSKTENRDLLFGNSCIFTKKLELEKSLLIFYLNKCMIKENVHVHAKGIRQQIQTFIRRVQNAVCRY